jgi:hypothetical protein
MFYRYSQNYFQIELFQIIQRIVVTGKAAVNADILFDGSIRVGMPKTLRTGVTGDIADIFFTFVFIRSVHEFIGLVASIPTVTKQGTLFRTLDLGNASGGNVFFRRPAADRFRPADVANILPPRRYSFIKWCFLITSD